MEKCLTCGNTGILMKMNPEGNGDAEFRLCPCIKKICACGGVKPYYEGLRDGKDVWCECRKYRVKRDTLKKIFANSQIPKKYRFKFLPNFKVISQKAAGIIQMLSPLTGSGIPEAPRKGWYLWGEPGGGKTLLACIILQELMLRDVVQGKFVNVTSNFFQKIRNSFHHNPDSEETAGVFMIYWMNMEMYRVSFSMILECSVIRSGKWKCSITCSIRDIRKKN